MKEIVKINVRIYNQIRDQVWSQVGDGVYCRVNDQVYNLTCEQTWEGVYSPIKNQAGSAPLK